MSIQFSHSRITTAEIAAQFYCSCAQARQLMRAAGIPFVRAGNTLLWDGAAVEQLLAAIQLAQENAKQRGWSE